MPFVNIEKVPSLESFVQGAGLHGNTKQGNALWQKHTMHPTSKVSHHLAHNKRVMLLRHMTNKRVDLLQNNKLPLPSFEFCNYLASLVYVASRIAKRFKTAPCEQFLIALAMSEWLKPKRRFHLAVKTLFCRVKRKLLVFNV